MDFVTDFAEIDLDGLIYTVNCGQGHYKQILDGLDDDPNAFNGGSWGTPDVSAKITVSDVNFVGDVINWGYDRSGDFDGVARQLNKDHYWPSEPGGTEWWYIPITGQLYGGSYDSPDFIPGYTAETTGTGPEIAGRHFGPYETRHSNYVLALFAGQGTDAESMRNVLKTAGTQNLGQPGERDMVFHFDANSEMSYKLQLLFFTTLSNESAMQILVEGDTYVTDLNVRGDILTASHALNSTVLMYTCIVEAKDNKLDIMIRMDLDLSPAYIGMINAITVEPIPKAYNPNPEDGYEHVDPDSDVLSWTNPPPYKPSDTVTVDVYILGVNDPNLADPNWFDDNATELLSGQAVESVTLSSFGYDLTIDPNDYYWRVDVHDPNIGTIKGDLWFFHTKPNEPPSVDAGPDQCSVEIASGESYVTVELDGFAWDNDPLITSLWSVISKPAGADVQFYDNTDPETMADLDTKGLYVLKLTMNDGIFPAVFDTVNILVTDADDIPVADVIYGHLDWLNKVSDLDLSGNVVYAVNCGQRHYTGVPDTDPNAFDGGLWGITNNNRYLVVDGVQFTGDVINWGRPEYGDVFGVARQLNKDYYWPYDPGGIEWWYIPMTGQLYGGPYDSPDYIPGYTAETTGYSPEIVGMNYAPYEGWHSSSIGGLFVCDGSADGVNLKQILAVAGIQNSGLYDNNLGISERDMTFHFEGPATEMHQYKVQILFYDLTGDTNLRVDIGDLTVLDKMSVAQCDAQNAIVYTISTVFVPAGEQLDITIGTATDGLEPRLSSGNAIVVTDLGAPGCELPQVDAGTADDSYIPYFGGDDARVHLNGSIIDGDGFTQAVWTVETANSEYVWFDDISDPAADVHIGAGGDYTLRMTVTDQCFEPDPVVRSDTVSFTVYDNACIHAHVQPGYTKDPGDLDDDCDVDLADFAVLAEEWLLCTATNDECD